MRRKAFILVLFALCGFLFVLNLWLGRSVTESVDLIQPRVDISSTEEPMAEFAAEAVFESVSIRDEKQGVEEGQPNEDRTSKTPIARKPSGYHPDQLTIPRPVDAMGTLAVRDAVDIITGATSANNSQRFRAVADLYEADLPEAEAARLIDYLKDEDRYVGMSDAAMHVLINEIVAIFHDRPQLSDDYLEASKYVINNESEHEVIRDYTLQGLSRGIGNASEEQAEMIREVFWDCLDETDASLAGTALLALNRERRMDSLTDDAVARLGEEIIAFLENPDVGERTRIPAMQIADAMELSGLNDHLARISSGPNTFSERIVIKSIGVK